MSNQLYSLETLSWENVNWAIIKKNVTRIQERIYKASRNKKYARVKDFQKFLIKNISAKLLAIRVITDNNKIKEQFKFLTQTNLNSKDKINIFSFIAMKNITSLPVRDSLFKTNTDRRLALISITDKVKQLLAKLALDPEWNAKFQEIKCISTISHKYHYSIEKITLELGQGKPEYILNGSIVLNTLGYEPLLKKVNTTPIITNQIRAWLNSGMISDYFEHNESTFYSARNNTGYPAKNIIAPLLLEIALNDIEKQLYMWLEIQYKNLELEMEKEREICIIRYRNSFLLIHSKKDILLRTTAFLNTWLAQIGLQLNSKRSSVKVSTEGFDFLGFTFIHIWRKQNLDLKIFPSRISKVMFLLSVKTIVQEAKGKAAFYLIQRLVPRIKEWGTYFANCECKETFKRMDYMIFQKIKSWAFRHHAFNKNKTYFKNKFFPFDKSYLFQGKEYKTNWLLTSNNNTSFIGNLNKATYMIKLSWIRNQDPARIEKNIILFNKSKLDWFRYLGA